MLSFRFVRKRVKIESRIYVMIPLGRIPDDSGGKDMIKEFCDVLNKEYKHIILDMGRSYFVGDSAGVFFSRALNLAKEKGVVLKLCNVSPKNENAIRCLGMWDLLEIFPTRKTALQSFQE